jgi:uncharacterized protein (TIGR00369 family)
MSDDHDAHRDLQRDLADRMAGTAFYGWLGSSVVSAREGEVEIEMQAEPHHLNLQGLVHGGVIATLLDSAAGMSVKTRIGEDRRHVTAQLNVNYLSPAQPGRLVARGTAVRVGVSIAFAEAEVTDERGRVVARATSVISVMPAR